LRRAAREPAHHPARQRRARARPARRAGPPRLVPARRRRPRARRRRQPRGAAGRLVHPAHRAAAARRRGGGALARAPDGPRRRRAAPRRGALERDDGGPRAPLRARRRAHPRARDPALGHPRPPAPHARPRPHRDTGRGDRRDGRRDGARPRIRPDAARHPGARRRPRARGPLRRAAAPRRRTPPLGAPELTPSPPDTRMEAMTTTAELRDSLSRVRHEVGKAVVGQDGAITGLLIALLANGHVLLEGVPGVAKTLLVRSLSRSLSLETRRVQFTPDLMPGDITGSVVYDPKTGEFEFREGPVFTNILLADEINRTPPKTQSALLEA